MGINYTTSRSARKSLSIVVKHNSVLVKAPMSASDSVIDNFVQSKTKWIEKCLRQFGDNIDARISNYQAVYIAGRVVPLDFSSNKTRLEGNKVYINKKYADNPKSQISKVATDIARYQLSMELDRVSSILNIGYTRFGTTSARTKWGSCNSKGEIKLNFRLIMLPSPLMLYVIVHELCHIVYLDHSKNFWGLVSKICPNYKQYKGELKHWSLLNKLY